jgi:hypothetical protein
MYQFAVVKGFSLLQRCVRYLHYVKHMYNISRLITHIHVQHIQDTCTTYTRCVCVFQVYWSFELCACAVLFNFLFLFTSSNMTATTQIRHTKLNKLLFDAFIQETNHRNECLTRLKILQIHQTQEIHRLIHPFPLPSLPLGPGKWC